MIEKPSLKELLKLSRKEVTFKIYNLGHIIHSLKENMKDRIAHEKTKRKLDILSGLAGIIVL